jgi:hypothetical protein
MPSELVASGRAFASIHSFRLATATARQSPAQLLSAAWWFSVPSRVDRPRHSTRSTTRRDYGDGRPGARSPLNRTMLISRARAGAHVRWVHHASYIDRRTPDGHVAAAKVDSCAGVPCAWQASGSSMPSIQRAAQPPIAS